MKSLMYRVLGLVLAAIDGAGERRFSTDYGAVICSYKHMLRLGSLWLLPVVRCIVALRLDQVMRMPGTGWVCRWPTLPGWVGCWCC